MIEFLAANWLWIVLLVLFVAMHRGGHGCGMHGTHGQGGQGRHGHAEHRTDDTDQRRNGEP